ncbi:MAG TPA: regulatory protein RecX [Ignavibacteriaceae bacterium]|nr:regulatory protein RecX [Ignavibacteriaceae bacterium]
MKIERVVKKDDENVIIYLDNQEKLFLSYEVFLKNRLKKDMEITEDGFSFLVRENQKYFIRKKAFNLLGRRLHSCKELRMKLLRNKYDSTLVDSVLEYLKEKNLLNDYEFGKQYAGEKIRTKAWGRNKIISELFKKGLSRGIIDEILNEENLNYTDNAFTIAEKKLKILSKRDYDGRQLSSKLYTFLSSKGYDYDTITEVVKRLLQDDESSDF